MSSRQATEDRIIEELRSADGASLGTADVATRLGLHPNGVRVQLRRLAARGLVDREQEHGATGRPRDRWRLSTRAIAEAGRPHVGWAMARSLARAIPPTRGRLVEVEAAGADLGIELAQGLGADDVEGADHVRHALDALGFEPTSEETAGGVRYRLMSCPYADVVRENPAVVCTLHKGIVRGILEHLRTDGRITRFEPRDPAEAGCVIEVGLEGR